MLRRWHARCPAIVRVHLTRRAPYAPSGPPRGLSSPSGLSDGGEDWTSESVSPDNSDHTDASALPEEDDSGTRELVAILLVGASLAVAGLHLCALTLFDARSALHFSLRPLFGLSIDEVCTRSQPLNIPCVDS